MFTCEVLLPAVLPLNTQRAADLLWTYLSVSNLSTPSSFNFTFWRRNRDRTLRSLYRDTSTSSVEISMATPTTSEEELSFWMKPGGKGGPVCGGANGVDASKTEEKTPPSRATVTRLVLVGLSVPLGLIALSIAVAMYLPPVHKVLARKSFYLQYYGIYGAILATLVFSLGATFPRVQASAQLLSIFGSLFIIAFAYFCAVLSVIVESAAGFILAMVQFIGCWELLVLSLIGMELEENIPGKIATCVAYIVNHAVIVALRPPSQMPVSDAILAGVVMLAIAWFFIAHVCKVVDKIQDDSQN